MIDMVKDAIKQRPGLKAIPPMVLLVLLMLCIILGASDSGSTRPDIEREGLYRPGSLYYAAPTEPDVEQENFYYFHYSRGE